MKHVNMGSVGYDPTTNRCEQARSLNYILKMFNMKKITIKILKAINENYVALNFYFILLSILNKRSL